MFEPLSLLNLLITVGLVIGGIVAYYHGFSRTANEVQERVINALQSEIQTLHDRIGMLEQENARLSYIVTTLCSALKQLGIHVTIDGDTVSIHDHNGSSYHHTRIYGAEVSSVQEQNEQKSHTFTPEHKPARRRSKKAITSQEA